MSKYYVLSNIKHDGELYQKGDYIELPEDRGSQLEADGIVSSNETIEQPVDQSANKEEEESTEEEENPADNL